MSTYDPETHLTHVLGVHLIEEPFASPHGAIWVPRHNTVWIQPNLHPHRRRSTLGHEAQHIELGVKHTNGSIERHRIIENLCDTRAARRLITVEDLAEQVSISPDPGEWAANLRVTGRMIRARLRSLTPGQRRLLDSIHLDP